MFTHQNVFYYDYDEWVSFNLIRWVLSTEDRIYACCFHLCAAVSSEQYYIQSGDIAFDDGGQC